MSNPSTSRGAVLISGTSSGIGQATALHLDRLGYRVFAGVRKEADAERLRQTASPLLTPVILDVTNSNHIASVLQQVTQALGPNGGLTALVNNAGVVEGGPLECMALDRVRRQFEVNVFGHLTMTQTFLPLIRVGHGRIVTIVSAVTDSPLPFLGAYAGSKCALRGLMLALRRELRWHGVPVSMVMPGFIRGPMWDEVARTMAKVEVEDRQHHYLEMLEGLIQMFKPTIGWGSEPIVVARTVGRILQARRPGAIYRCGPGSQMSRLGNWLPEGLVHGAQRLALQHWRRRHPAGARTAGTQP